MPLDVLILRNPFSLMEIVLRLGLALIVGTAIGIEREYKNRPAGMRTHVLVCLGSCTVALLESLLSAQGNFAGGTSFTVGRLAAQVISGIGFLGAGTILMTNKRISGLTTAASVWNVACLGLLAGYGYYWMALVVSVMVIAVLQLMGRYVHINAVKHVEVRFVNRVETLPYINQYFESLGVKVLDVDFHVESADDAPIEGPSKLYINLYTLHLPRKVSYVEIVNHLSEYVHVRFVRTRNT